MTTWRNCSERNPRSSSDFALTFVQPVSSGPPLSSGPPSPSRSRQSVAVWLCLVTPSPLSFGRSCSGSRTMRKRSAPSAKSNVTRVRSSGSAWSLRMAAPERPPSFSGPPLVTP